MQIVRSLFGFLFLFFFCLTSSQSLAQNSKDSKKSGKNDYPETKLRISIPIPSQAKSELKREQFKIVEDGISQGIDSLENLNQSTSYGLVLDTSGSMRTRLTELKILSFSLINQLREKDEMAIASLKMESELVHALSSDKVSLTKSLSDLYTGGGTAIYDGIIATSDYLKENSKKDRRIIIVLTDAGEKVSSVKIDRVASVLSEENILLFVIQIKDTLNNDTIYDSSKKTLNKLDFLTKISGGFMLNYTPPKKITQAEIEKFIKEANDFMLPLTERVRSTYRVSYFSANNKFDGKPRLIQIEWQDEEGKTNTQEFRYIVPKK